MGIGGGGIVTHIRVRPYAYRRVHVQVQARIYAGTCRCAQVRKRARIRMQVGGQAHAGRQAYAREHIRR
mgnify:FL=1